VRHLALQLVVALGDATDNGGEGWVYRGCPSAGVVKPLSPVGGRVNRNSAQMPSLVVKPAVLLGELTGAVCWT